MANLSYLFSLNQTSKDSNSGAGRNVRGIAESNYQIPIAFKVLISANPRTCRSCIWEHEDEIALMADYAGGLERFLSFASRIKQPAVQPFIQESIQFLRRDENRQSHFLLECGEIFEMSDTPLMEQNFALLAQIENIEQEMKQALDELNASLPLATGPRDWLGKLLGPKQEINIEDDEAMLPIYKLGIAFWSNELYYRPADK